MSDGVERALERDVASGKPGSLERLKAAWARSLVWRECPDCQARVPSLAWDRHVRLHELDRQIEERHSELIAELSSDSSDLPARPVGPIGGRPSRAPLWHRIVVDPSWTRSAQTRVRFFQEESGSTNMPVRGSLLEAHHFWLYGISLIPDMGAPEAEVRRIYNEGNCWLLFGRPDPPGEPPSYIAGDYATRTLMPPFLDFMADEIMADPESELAGRMPQRVVSICGRPLDIHAHMTFGFDLFLPFQVKEPVGIMAVFHGISLRPLVG